MGDLAIDVGANIGITASVLAMQTHRVAAFEPFPLNYERLQENVRSWGEVGQRVTIFDVALSDVNGESGFTKSADFHHNEGMGHLDADGELRVKTVTLDSIFREPVGLLKIDVEGNELDVLKGAHYLLESRMVRDIVFEEHAKTPTPVTELLESYGYKIFHVSSTFRRIVLSPRKHGTSVDYLATLDEGRALRRLSTPGWHVLRGR